jgi:hypothetical protein
MEYICQENNFDVPHMVEEVVALVGLQLELDGQGAGYGRRSGT